jgi:ribonuclease HI
MDAKVEGLCGNYSRRYMLALNLSKKNGWRTSSGKIVSNKDLFCTLDEAVSALESRKLDVKFWWIDRQVYAYRLYLILFLLTVTLNG